MSDVYPFFSPANRDFHPRMSFCLLQAATKMSLGDTSEGRAGVCFQQLNSSNSHLAELGKCLPRMQLQVRDPEEIRQELFRLRGRWNRVIELKIVEAGLRNLPICPE